MSPLRNMIIVLVFAISAAAQAIPGTEGETLSGNKIVLRSDCAGHVAVLNIGFSRAGGDSSQRWDKELRRNLAGEKDLRIYSVAELQDAPKLVRGMIKHGMRNGVPKEEHDSFVILSQEEDAWKKTANFSQADDAYILLVDPAGSVRWHTHGKSPDAESLNALHAELTKLGTH